MKYGVIDNGILRSIELTPYKQRVQGEDGIIREIDISIESQIMEAANQGLKPIEEIDPEQMDAPIGKMVIPHPVDYGDYIGFEYETVVDTQMYRNEIKKAKAELDSTDYQVIKCYEASLVGESLPYDVQELHANRQALRDRINELEALL